MNQNIQNLAKRYIKEFENLKLPSGRAFCCPNYYMRYMIDYDGSDYFWIKDRKIEGYITKEKCIFDRVGLYDKPAKCPINLPLPKNKKQIDFVIESLKWLLTPEGERASCYYDTNKWITKYPEGI